MKQKIFLFSFLLFVLAMMNDAYGADNAKVDEQAPGFTLTDAFGQAHSLTDYKGNWVVLEWVNFGCPFVRKHYDSGNIQSLQKEYTSKGVIWLSICSSAPGKQGYYEGKALLEEVKEHESHASAYLVDANGTVGRTYGAKTTPHMFIINPQGVLVYAGGIDNIASTDQEDLKKANNYVKEVLDEGISGRQITVSGSRPYGCSVKYK